VSQRELFLAESSVISAAWSAIAAWETTAAGSTPVLFVSNGARSPDGKGWEEFGVDGKEGRTVAVDGPACSEGRRTASIRGC